LTSDQAVAAAFRDERARVLATLIRFTGDWELAEECVQDAFLKALERWPTDGVPRSPGAWLTTTARNRALDVLRRSNVEAAKLREVAAMPGPDDDGEWPDDRLRLIFTCCHPALTLEARVALTLRTVAGLTTDEIARAFLTPVPTMAQRLVRAQRKIRNAGIPYRVPPLELMGERLPGVLAVVYLLFNEGYSAERRSLAAEAIRLGRLLHRLMPDEPEVRGLLALMLLQHSRAEARTDAGGELVTLEDQDRSRWDRGLIDEGLRLLPEEPGPYQLQAAIAACHATARTNEETDWTEIASLYGDLASLTKSPFVELNRAVAVALADGPAVALPLLDALEEPLQGYYLLPATRADLLRRLDRRREAVTAYEQARELAPTEVEQRYLTRRIAEMS
jgi:RNA polymerase sigma-70 factor, ECF subfamily